MLIDLKTWAIEAPPNTNLNTVCDCGGQPTCTTCDGDGTRVALTYYERSPEGTLEKRRFDALLLRKAHDGTIQAKGWLDRQRIITTAFAWVPTDGRVSPT